MKSFAYRVQCVINKVDKFLNHSDSVLPDTLIVSSDREIGHQGTLSHVICVYRVRRCRT